MQDYTKKVIYKDQVLTEGETLDVPNKTRLKIDPNHPSYVQQTEEFSHEGYKYPYMPLYLGQYNMDVTKVNVNVLRLLIKWGTGKLALPNELLFAKDFILEQINYHSQFYFKGDSKFVYITIRTTEKDCYYSNSQTWHVDGFQGSRIGRHKCEQDIMWSNVNPTEFLLQPFYLDGLNPSKHDINQYFEDHAHEGCAYQGVENGVYLTTPYNIHRVTNALFDKKRVFIRLTFSPVEIEDPTNTPNPMFNGVDKAKDRDDVRNNLWKYETDETPNNGFKKLIKQHKSNNLN